MIDDSMTDEELAAFYAAYPYIYVNRWHDAEGPHYFGVYTEFPTLKEAQEKLAFSLIVVPVDLVYGPCSDIAEIYEFMEDVSLSTDDDDPDGLGSTGTFDWL